MTAKRKAPAGHAPSSAADQVRAYFAAATPVARKRLGELRAAIKAAAPDAIEAFSYGIPGFRLDDRAYMWYAAFTAHVSIYPIPRDFEKANVKALAAYTTSGKGTLRFAMDRPIPKGLVGRVAKARAAQLRALAKARKR